MVCLGLAVAAALGYAIWLDYQMTVAPAADAELGITALGDWLSRQMVLLLVALPPAVALGAAGTGAVALLRREEARRSQLADALAEREMALAEIHHRVKNNLAIVQSLLMMESMSAPPEARGGYQDSLQRLQAMAMVHELLYRSGEFRGVSCREYAGQLCSLLVGDHPAVTLDVQGDDEAHLDLDRAIAFAMAVNEMVTNALKHAFAGGRAGRLSVLIRAEGEGRLRLVVADDGPGLPPGFDPARVQSLGMRLLTNLARQLEGELTFAGETGTRVTLTFPAG